jgi:protease-4
MSKSTKWFLVILGVFAIVALFSFLIISTIISSVSERTELVTTGTGDKIAVVELFGVITSAENVVRQIKNHRENKSIKAILLRIESPGGGVAASQEIYEEVRKTRESGKPVVVSMGALAASGGYYVSCGASRLVANRGTLTGSIGVISEFLQLRGALDKLGIDIKTIKSGRLKDAGSYSRKMTEEDQKYFQSLMDDVHQQFMHVVETERNLSHEQVLRLGDGRVFTGEQAVRLHLVDTLGTYEDAISIAAALAGIEGKPSIVKERKRRSVWDALFGDVAERVEDLKNQFLDNPVLSYRFVGPF